MVIKTATNDMEKDYFQPLQTTSTSAGNVSVGGTTTKVLDANTARRFVEIVNDSDETVYLALGDAAVMNKGIRLNASGGSFSINALNLYQGIIHAICSSGGKNITVVEG